MNNWDTPADFETNFKIGDVKVSYESVGEFSQGGPRVGYISINGQPINKCKFGGPSLHQDGYLYLPAYVALSGFGWGFQLAKINIKDHNVYFIGNPRSLIFMDKIEGNRLYYYEDVSKKKYNYYEI